MFFPRLRPRDSEVTDNWQIIGRDTSRVTSEYVKLIAISEAHDNICKIEVGTPIYCEIQQLLRDVADQAPKRIEELFRPCMQMDKSPDRCNHSITDRLS